MLSGVKSLIFDPFKGVGLPEPKAKADIVLCSHSHSDHNNCGSCQTREERCPRRFHRSKADQ